MQHLKKPCNLERTTHSTLRTFFEAEAKKLDSKCEMLGMSK